MMRTVSCPVCGMQTSAEELAIAEIALAEHVKTHAGDKFTGAKAAELVTELQASQEFFRTVSSLEGVEVKMRQAAMFRIAEIQRILS